MGIYSGFKYNIKGLMLGIKTPRLLMLGLLRFVIVVGITLLLAGIILTRHSEMMSVLWTRPESVWIIWLWHLLSWLLTLFLLGISAIVSYFLAQIVFSVLIMDLMSRVTEQIITGHQANPPEAGFIKQMAFLLMQEIPRAVFPVFLMMMIMVAGWLTPLGPIVTILSSLVAAVFLAWDNTDLVPARRLVPLKQRFGMLMKSLPFHLGFGLLLLIPIANILFLSFAPVGATLFHMKK